MSGYLDWQLLEVQALSQYCLHANDYYSKESVQMNIVIQNVYG